MDELLLPGGYMIHKIDFRDHGMFSDKHHPLTFLTIPGSLYTLMTHDSGKPNRRLISYYRRKTTELGYDTHLLITRIVGSESEILPHKETVTSGVDYSGSISLPTKSVHSSKVNSERCQMKTSWFQECFS